MCRGSLGLCKKHQKVVLNLKNYSVRLHNLTYITLIRNLLKVSSGQWLGYTWSGLRLFWRFWSDVSFVLKIDKCTAWFHKDFSFLAGWNHLSRLMTFSLAKPECLWRKSSWSTITCSISGVGQAASSWFAAAKLSCFSKLCWRVT